MTRIFLVCLTCCLALPGTVSASASPPRPPGPAPLVALRVLGSVQLEDIQIEVRCDERASSDQSSASCRIRASFEMRAVGPTLYSRPLGSDDPDATRRPPSPQADRIEVNGEVLTSEPVNLATGEAVHVELDVRRSLSAQLEHSGYLVTSPMVLRHPLLGDTRWVDRGSQTASGRLVDSERVRISGLVRIDATETQLVEVEIGGQAVEGRAELETAEASVGLSLEAPAPSDSPLQHGGPVLAVGVRSSLEGTSEDPRFSLLAGYEIAFNEWLFVTANFETDFDSIMESVVVEAATPFVLLFPSVSAGVGVVARQLGARDADAAFRIRAGIGIWGVGVTADVDYWPETGEWTGSMRARLSL